MQISDFSWNYQIIAVSGETAIWKTGEAGESRDTAGICLPETENASIKNWQEEVNGDF